MKTITGSVISSKPIRLSKAASVLKNFISKETGASNAVSSFLRRTSASFNELAQFHKELGNTKKSGSKQKKSRVGGNVAGIQGKGKEDGLVGEEGKKLNFGGEQSLKYVDNGVGGSDVEGGVKTKQKKKDGDVEVEKKIERKRKKAEEEEKSRSLEDSQEGHGRKKKKRRHEDHWLLL